MTHNKLTSTIITMAVGAALMVSGCNSASMHGNADLGSHIDSLSYAFGYLNGKQMKQQGMSDIEPDVFQQAMQRALDEDSAAIPQTKMLAMLRKYMMDLRQKKQSEMMEKGKTNKKEGDAFLMKNKKKDDVKTTDSGLQYKVLEQGNGVSPSAKDTVVVNYTGTLLDGTEFDSNDSTSFPLNHVIKGWTEGIQLMHQGATYKFWIPGDLAYGQRGGGAKIGPNQTLVFKVKLLKVKK